jgi:hypothetical protein
MIAKMRRRGLRHNHEYLSEFLDKPSAAINRRRTRFAPISLLCRRFVRAGRDFFLQLR